MKKRKKLYIAVLSFVLTLNSVPAVVPYFSAEAVPTDEAVTADTLKAMRNFLLNNEEEKIDLSYDLNEDGRIDSFDMCLLRKKYVEQEKSKNFYSLSSDLVHDTDAKYGMSVMADDFYSKRIIVKAKKNYSFESYSPTNVISGPDNIYVVQFDTVERAEICISALQKDSNIEYVELDEYMSCEEIETEQANSNSWGVEAIEADKYAEYLGNNSDSSSSVVVAVVDTGVAYHDFLKDRILDTGYDLVDNDPDPNDKHYHGTHVAGTVVDCTSDLNIDIMPVRVLDENGSGSVLNVGNGIRYAAENGADVINLSLGGKGSSRYIDDSVEYAVEIGATVVVAAGNDSNNTKNYYPAHLDNCIVVSACDSENQKAKFSNYGESVDVTAPGVNIKSCIPGGNFKTLSGTSMATPHISAAAAMIKYADPQATPAQIEQKIKDISLDLGDTGKDVYYGYGLPKLSKLIEVPIIASGKCGDDVYYTLDENGLLTISGTGDMWNYDYGESPFDSNSSVLNIVIKNGVTSIGKSFVNKCNMLENVSIPDSVTLIDEYAFYSCSNIKSIIIPDSVTSIEYGAFAECSNLQDVILSDNLIQIGGRAFFECEKLKNIKIPDGVKSIQYNAFYACTNLEEIILPDSIESLGSVATFANCINLRSVKLPNGLKTIPNSVFSNCTKLNNVVIPNSVTEIETTAFEECTSLEHITIPDSVTNMNAGSIFYNCKSLKSVILSNNITLISNSTFKGCTNLSSIVIPENVKSISAYAFTSCPNLTKVTILNPSCDINYYAFSDNITVYSYTGSTAQHYAEVHKRPFVALD
ncbi:MAG: leucine-rich repeat protein [Ruminococcus sp.]|nr:leucine-rich repeat protein [Ruminococcus sp.]